VVLAQSTWLQRFSRISTVSEQLLSSITLWNTLLATLSGWWLTGHGTRVTFHK